MPILFGRDFQIRLVTSRLLLRLKSCEVKSLYLSHLFRFISSFFLVRSSQMPDFCWLDPQALLVLFHYSMIILRSPILRWCQIIIFGWSDPSMDWFSPGKSLQPCSTIDVPIGLSWGFPVFDFSHFAFNQSSDQDLFLVEFFHIPSGELT